MSTPKKPHIPIVEFLTFCENIKKYHMECYKLDIIYNISDSRCWTAIVNPGTNNIFVTFHVNRYVLGDRYFDILSNDKVMANIYVEDIYDSIALLTGYNTTVEEPSNEE